jgi:hypothetical protein
MKRVVGLIQETSVTKFEINDNDMIFLEKEGDTDAYQQISCIFMVPSMEILFHIFL